MQSWRQPLQADCRTGSIRVKGAPAARQAGATIATLMIGNDERGFAEAIAWVAEHAPGPRVVVGLEGTRSYGIGLARVLQAAGLTWWRSNVPVGASGGGASRTRSTPTWPRCTRCAWTPTGCHAARRR
jgi:hypothetical protein